MSRSEDDSLNRQPWSLIARVLGQSVARSLARRIARSVYCCSARSALDTKSAQASVLVFKDDSEVLLFSHLHARWSFCCAGNNSRAAKKLSLTLNDWSFPVPRSDGRKLASPRGLPSPPKQFLLPCYFQRLYFIVWKAPYVTSRGHL